MPENNSEGFAVIPNAVLQDKSLSSTAKLVYAIILSLCQQEGYCWSGNTYIADMLGITSVQVSRCIGQLSVNHLTLVNPQSAQRRIYINKNVKVPDPLKQKQQSNFNENSKVTTAKMLKSPTQKKQTNNINKKDNLIDKLITTNETGVSTEVKKAYTDKDVEMATLLRRLVLENYPWDDKPTTETDYATINLLYRKDGRDYDTIEFIIRWSQQDDFWRQNIRSASKLRKQFTTLMVRAKSDLDEKNNRIAII